MGRAQTTPAAFSKPLLPPSLTILPRAAVEVPFLRRFEEKHARVFIKAGVGGLPLGVTQHGSPQLPEPQRRAVVDGVLGVVQEAVGNHQVEIVFQVSHRAIGVTLQLRLHSREVHGPADELWVVWNLRTDSQHRVNVWKMKENTIKLKSN